MLQSNNESSHHVELMSVSASQFNVQLMFLPNFVLCPNLEDLKLKEQSLSNTQILKKIIFNFDFSFPLRYIAKMILQRFLTSVLLLNIVPVIAPCPIIRFHHPSCWVNWTLIKLNISSNTFSRALIDKRMGHLIKVFILSCLLSQGLLKSLPAGLETESVSKMPEWEIKITGERKEIVNGKKMSGRESKIFSFQDTLDNLGWGNILWFLLNFLQFWGIYIY